MSPARQALALLMLGLVAGAVGFAGASALVGSGSAAHSAPAPLASARRPVPPEPAPAIVPTAAAEPVAPPEAPGPPAPPTPAPAERPAPPETAPVPPPTPTAEPTPAPAPAPEPVPHAPATTSLAPPPVPPPTPAGPPAAVLEDPPDPPTGVSIAPGTALTGYEPAHRVLAQALARSAPGSVDQADLGRSLALWRTYLGPDAVPAPEGRRATIARALRANAWWFRDRGSPHTRVLLRDQDGIILTYRPGQGFVVNPVATTGRWRGLNDDVPAAALAEALMGMGVERRAGERRFTAWEYYDAEGDPQAIVPGTSGMAQARVALVMAHAQAETGDPRFARAALEALAAFTVDVDQGGVRSMVRVDPAQTPMPWYVERAYPGESPWKGGALNGFMVTLLNLRGVAAIFDDAPGGGADAATATGLARDLADRGALTLQRHLPDHDSGAWSYYGLLTPGRPWRSYLADLNYHCYHVRLLAQLAGPYPDLGFAATSDKWQGYVDSAGATCPAR